MYGQALVLGRVGSDPEQKNGVTWFAIAENDVWKDKNGEKQEKTTWHRAIIFNEKLGSVCMEYVKKGKVVLAVGKYEFEYDENKNCKATFKVNTVKFV